MIRKIWEWLYDYFWDIVIGAFYTCMFLVALRIIDVALADPYVKSITPDMIELRNAIYNAFKAYSEFEDAITKVTKFHDLAGIFYTGIPLSIKKYFTGTYRTKRRYH